MKKFIFPMLFLGFTQMASAQTVYLENFNSPWPANMVRINNDGRTPASGVSFMGTNAWITKKTANPADSSAVSTSWYTPAGASDDWMITPPITIPANNPIIKWRGLAFDSSYPDGYKVKISTTASQTITGFTDIFSIAGESSEWAWHGVDLSNYAGQTVTFAFVNQSNDMYALAIDDIEVLGVANAYELAFNRIKSYEYSVGGNVAIPYRITNNGGKNITSFDLNWSTDGGVNVTTQTVNGVNIGPFNTYNGSAAIPLVVTQGTNYDLKVWTSNPNGSADQVPSNDTLSKKIYGLYTKPAKKTLVEESTGAWCGYCPDGALKLQAILNTNPNAVGYSNHNGDPMATTQSDSVNSYVSGYPSGLVDRFYQESLEAVESDRGQWAALTSSRNNLAVPFSISGSTSFNYNNNELTVNISATATGDLDQEYRLNAILVEDSVTGGSSYNQTNYYNGANGMPNYGPNPIVGYVHRHVMRKMIGGVWGLPNSVPATVTNGQVINKTLTYTVPATYNLDRLHVIIVIQKYTANKNDRPILNAMELPLNSITAIDKSGKLQGSLKVYPNPMASSTLVEYTLTHPQEVAFEMLDMTGRQVYAESFGMQTVGTHQFTLVGKEISNGVYFLKTNINGSVVTEKIVVNK